MSTLNNLITNNSIKNACTSILTIYMFIQENLLPERLMIEIDNNINDNKSIKKSFPLIKYFNQQLYEENKACLWLLLDNWFASNEGPPANSGKKSIRLNGYALDFCLNFVSSDTHGLYMNAFIQSINKYINDNTVLNRDVIYENKNLFPFLIESLFYFFNIDNAEAIVIQKNLLKTFK